MDTDIDTTTSIGRDPDVATPRPSSRRPGSSGSGSHFRASASAPAPTGGLTDRLKGLASLLAILALLAGVPLALVVFVGWPFPSKLPEWERIRDAFQRQGVPVEVVVNGLAIVVWLAWAQLAWALGVETVAVAKGRAARRAPLLPGTQLLARQLIASAALIMGSLSVVKPASAGPLAALQEAEPAEDTALRADGAPPGSEPRSSTSSPTTTPTTSATTATTTPTAQPVPQMESIYEVRRGDTFWGLAEQHLGNGMRWREIRDRNVGRAVAPGRVLGMGDDHLDVGWRIILPPTTRSSGTLPTEPLPTLPTDEPLTAPPEAAPPGTRLAELAEEDGAAVSTSSSTSEGVPQAGAGPTTAPPAAPAAPEATPVASQSPATPPAVPEQQQQQHGPAGVREVVVQPGDHFWGLAERRLQEAWGRPVTAEEIAPYWRALVDQNRDRVSSGDPDLIFPGEQFIEPAPPASPGASVPPPAPTPPTPPSPPPAPTPPETTPPTTSPPTTQAPTTTAPTTTAPSTTTTTADDEGGDETAAPPVEEAPPEDTRPPEETRGGGDRSVEEPPAAPTTTPPTTTAPPPPTTSPPTTASTTTEPPPSTAPPTTTAPPPTAPPTTAPPPTEAPTTTAAPSTTAAPTTDEQPRDSDDERAAADEDDEGATIPIAPVAATAALAGLVLAALARRRRARSRSIRPGDIVEPRLADDISLERGLGIAAADVLDVVHLASRALGQVLDRHADLPSVVAITVAPSRKVTVYLSEPVEPIAPFEAGPPSEAWTFYPDEMEYWAGEEPTTPVLDALTAVGQTDAGEWVFVDLESLGALELDGDPTVAAELAQSMVAELSLQPVSEPMLDLTVIGMDELSPSVVQQGVLRVDRLDEDLVRRIERSAEQTSSLLERENLRSTAAARARGVAGDGLFVMVVAYGGAEPADPVLLERLAGAASPGGRGVAVVAIGSLGPGATRLIVTDDGRGHIPRIGLTFTAARLERHDLDRVAELLAREPEVSTRGPARTSQRSAAPSVTADEELEELGVDVDEAPVYEEPSWRYCVRIFADHLVEADTGDAVSFRYGENPDVPNKNTHRGPELLSYLALSGRAASATDVRDHLWWDRPVALGTVNKLIYGTRKVLGGADLLSLAQDDPVGRYRLSPEVVTDVELLSHALEHAHALAVRDPDAAMQVLRPHLARVEAVAFRSNALGQGLAEWAAAYRVIDRVEQPVIDAGLLAAKLCTEAGPDRYAEALWAVDQALQACPINEALVRAAMEIEARLGSTEAVNHRYLNLATKLARDELEPEPETSDLRARLGATGRRRGRDSNAG